MKLILHFPIAIAFILAAVNTVAQIPNNRFENWTNAGSYWTPDGWWTTNDSASGNVYAITRSTDHFPSSIGNYSMRMENNISILPDWGGVGLAWTGGWSGNNYPAFPIIGHPTSLFGYYKFMPQNNDTMEIHIRLYKNGTDIGGGQFKNAAIVASWTSFSMTFSAYADADSARIMILSCYDNDAPIPHGNSVLYIDNLNFDSLITDGISEPNDRNIISVYPNPSSGIVTVSVDDNHESKGILTIYNEVGQPVLTRQVSRHINSITLDFLSSESGIYFIQFISDQGINYCRDVIINH